jgi:hypothetical protein
MLLNNPLPAGEYRHNYVRLAFLLGTLLLFIGYVAAGQLLDHGNNRRFIENQFKDLIIESFSQYGKCNIPC